jgi:hypothetical protein
MSQSEGGSGSSIDFLSTHPANARRIKVGPNGPNGPNVPNGPNGPNSCSPILPSYLLLQIPCRSFYPRISLPEPFSLLLFSYTRAPSSTSLLARSILVPPRISSYLLFQIPSRSRCPLTSSYLLCLIQSGCHSPRTATGAVVAGCSADPGGLALRTHFG